MTREVDKTLKQEVEKLDLDDAGDLAKLKTIKRQRKAALTRTIGAIDVCVADRDPAGVQTKLSSLADQLENLTFVHDVYYAVITISDDEDECIKTEEFYESAQAAYTECVGKTRVWLDSVDEKGNLKPVLPPVKEEVKVNPGMTKTIPESDSEIRKYNESILQLSRIHI